MSVYDVDMDVVESQNVPVRVRQGVMLAWLKALVSPVVYLQGLFNAFRTAILYGLAHNGQVCFLQGRLNDTFAPVERGIYITDPPYYDAVPLYMMSEEKPVPLYMASEEEPVALYTASETYLTGPCFIINVPSAVAASAGYDVNYLKALVNKDRLPGKNNYSVVVY